MPWEDALPENREINDVTKPVGKLSLLEEAMTIEKTINGNTAELKLTGWLDTKTAPELEPHDLLFLYTDGVTEASNMAKELYGEKRLLEALMGIVPEKGNICELVCRRVKASVDAFAAGVPQADDITMLCLYYRGQNT